MNWRWLQKKLHFSSHYTSTHWISIFMLLTPFILILVIAFTFVPQNSSSPNFPSSLKIFNSNSSNTNRFSKDHNRQYSRLQRIEAILAKARFSIKEAAIKTGNSTSRESDDYSPNGYVYKNANAFLRSYEEMERVFKIYVYGEGEMPIFHNGPCRSTYSTEGNFIYELETGTSSYRTKNPDEAHVFFMPFSVVVMVQYLYESGSKDRTAIGNIVADYIETISLRHPFWNFSTGADHVMLSCHDWGPYSTMSVPHLFANSIRVLCNANTSEGFNPLKDLSLPEINLKTGGGDVKTLLAGSPPSERPIIAFFAGGLHGHIRHLLLHHWKEKDADMKVYNNLPRNVSYESMLRNSKFCLCPSGYEVASPRIVEAIYAGCVPVLISKGYVPPLSDVLEWSKFSVKVDVREIPNMKKILMGISKGEYLSMYENVRQVHLHFVMNRPPQIFDLFHMIVHSIWLRRLNMRIRD